MRKGFVVSLIAVLFLIYYISKYVKTDMSKSTPLNQLPANPGNEIMPEDPTIQEVLTEIGQGRSESVAGQPQYMPQMTPQQMFNGNPSIAPQEFLIPPPTNSYPQQFSPMNIGGIQTRVNTDVKQVLLIVAIAFIVQVLPVEFFVYKYLSVEHVPYSGVLIKSISAGILYFLVKKYIVF
jgi:hypothetical protein